MEVPSCNQRTMIAISTKTSNKSTCFSTNKQNQTNDWRQGWYSLFSMLILCEFFFFLVVGTHTCSKKATTKTVIKSVAVSKSWKFKSMGRPIIHPITTQKGICSNKNRPRVRNLYHPNNKHHYQLLHKQQQDEKIYKLHQPNFTT